MARGKKTDKEKTQIIIKTKLENPTISNRDIEKQTGVSRNAIDKIVKRIPDLVARSDKQLIQTIDNIIDDVIELTKNHTSQMREMKKLKSYDVKLLNEIAKTNFDRKQILTGKPTEIHDVTFSLEGKTTQEIEEIKERLLN